MKPVQGRTYANVKLPLQKLTAKSFRFEWTKQCEDALQELKSILISGQVTPSYDPNRETRLYVNEGPSGRNCCSKIHVGRYGSPAKTASEIKRLMESHWGY